jgi:hypothetical protein
MSMAQQRMNMRRGGGELDSFVWFFPLIGLAGGGIIGIPGVGLYVGLCVAALAINAIGTNSMTTQATLGALVTTIAHPFGSGMRTGANGKWWPPSQLAAWWSALGAVFLTIVPFVVHDVAPHLKYFPHHLVVPGLAIVSFIGYFFSIHAISVAKRGDRPPVLIERAILKERSASVASASIVGASMGIIAYIVIGHASTVRALLTTGHNRVFTGPDAYAGLGRGGAIGISIGVALILAFAMASVAYRKAWLEPHMARVAKLGEWQSAWLAAVGNAPPPLFISEAKTPENDPEVCSAIFQVPPGGTIQGYAAKADKLASALGVEIVSITPDVARDQERNPMPGATSATVFRVSYPLVPIAPGAHLSHEFTTKTPLYDFIVATTFRRIFSDLKLGEPVFWALSILTTPDSPGRMVETMWMLAPGTTFDQVAKAAHAIQEKSGARWLRVGRRSSIYGEGELVPGTFVSVLFGDPPQLAQFVNGKVFKAEDHRRFVDTIDWDARFRSVNVASAVAGPTLVGYEDVESELQELSGTDVSLRIWTFAYPAGLSAHDVEVALPELRTSGFPFVEFRAAEDPKKFQLLTAERDPLSLAYPFLLAAPKMLHRPVPGQPRLDWVVGVGADGEFVNFKFGTEDPHLLIGGMTGSGKSMSIISMLLQLATSNTPEDLEFRLVDPKTSLVPFRNLAHVSHFVMSLPGRDRHQDFLDLLHSTVREMENRYERLNELGLEDFTQARSMGQMIELPYIIVVVEEASLMLTSADKKAEKAIIDEVGKIANLGRGAGVYLVMATQYPSNKSIPNHLREQFSRIGFRVQDHTASNIIINESGLEDLEMPGQGKMRCGGLFVPFRGFLLHPGDGPAELDAAGAEELAGVVHHYGRPPDRTVILSHLPKGPRDRQVGSRGTWKPFTIAPIPDGIWDTSDEAEMAESKNSET